MARIHDFAAELESKGVGIIDVPAGKPIVLLHSRSNPEHAIMLWGDPAKCGTRTVLRLEGEPLSFYVVCACCSPEQDGVGPGHELDELLSGFKSRYPGWKIEGNGGYRFTITRKEELRLGIEFRQRMEEICGTHGIKTIYMRKAGAWYNWRYCGDSEEEYRVHAKEAELHLPLIQEAFRGAFRIY